MTKDEQVKLYQQKKAEELESLSKKAIRRIKGFRIPLPHHLRQRQ